MITKLKSSKGSSVPFALVFFMLAVIIGSLLISAAVLAHGHVRAMKSKKEAYYISVSLIKEIKSELDWKELTYDTEKTSEQNLTAMEEQGIFGNFIVDAIDTIANISPNQDYEEELVAEIESGGSTYDIYLTGEMSYIDYSLKFTITQIKKTTSTGKITILNSACPSMCSFSTEFTTGEEIEIRYLEGAANG